MNTKCTAFLHITLRAVKSIDVKVSSHKD